MWDYDVSKSYQKKYNGRVSLPFTTDFRYANFFKTSENIDETQLACDKVKAGKN